MSDVIAFQSASFPAELAADPAAAPEVGSGLGCLRIIYEGICGGSIAPLGDPEVDSEIGSAASVEAMGSTVLIHLQWLQRTVELNPNPDIWTIQVRGYGGWLRSLLGGRRRSNAGAEAVFEAILGLLLTLPDEFSEVQSRAWNDLDPEM